ncbi:MAG: DUF393 domain-containing protein [Cloacibacterium sp.]|jgi:predicted DCC family thiol-disulfide oxidoreductase YuxK|nr:DUF393 domain-containing protein [Cloacibacterium sp.]
MEINPNKYYILYDGDCSFCNRWVQWILRRDKKDRFLFASLQSKFGQNFLIDRNLERKHFNTLYLYKPNQFYYTQSDAVLRIAGLLGGKYTLVAQLRIFPRFLRDALYHQIAKNREKLVSQHCNILSEKDKEKFIE